MARVEIYFIDADGNLCEREDAVRAIVQEFDEDGDLIQETFAFVNGAH